MSSSIDIAFQNFSLNSQNVQQNGTTIATLPAAQTSWPTSTIVSLDPTQTLSVGGQVLPTVEPGSIVCISASDAVTTENALTPVSISSNYSRAFEITPQTDPQRFMARAVAVARKDSDDVLRDEHHEYFKTAVLPALLYLNANTIRVYNVTATASHAKTMNLLAANGIYVIVSLVTESVCIQMMNPLYTYQIYMNGVTVIDEFQAYANTLAFLTSNELVFPGTIKAKTKNTKDAIALEIACAVADKSFMRDMKSYMVTKSYRQIPVGAALVDEMGPATPDGLIGTRSVGEFYAWSDADGVCADFVGLNTYRFVTSSVTPVNSYDHLAKQMAALSCPFILTESGGQDVPAVVRDWKIVPQMYTDGHLYNHLSGQTAFQLFEMGGQNQGLYIESEAPLVPDQYGLASDLSAEFATAASLSAPWPPANVPLTPQPTEFTPAPELLPAFTPPSASVTFKNYETAEVDVVQDYWVAGTLPAATSSSTPSELRLAINPALGVDLLIPSQQWSMICSVSPDQLQSGSKVEDNVPWGSSCTVTS